MRGRHFVFAEQVTDIVLLHACTDARQLIHYSWRWEETVCSGAGEPLRHGSWRRARAVFTSSTTRWRHAKAGPAAVRGSAKKRAALDPRFC